MTPILMLIMDASWTAKIRTKTQGGITMTELTNGVWEPVEEGTYTVGKVWPTTIILRGGQLDMSCNGLRHWFNLPDSLRLCRRVAANPVPVEARIAELESELDQARAMLRDIYRTGVIPRPDTGSSNLSTTPPERRVVTK